MSPRQNRRRPLQRPLDGTALRGGHERVEEWPDGTWSVREVTGSSATKAYRCPGCDQEIGHGVPHVVTWPTDGAVADRRHWHPSCWRNRMRRSPKSQRPPRR